MGKGSFGADLTALHPCTQRASSVPAPRASLGLGKGDKTSEIFSTQTMNTRTFTPVLSSETDGIKMKMMLG